MNHTYEKTMIGHLIHYYRLKNQITMKDFVYDSTASSMICSTKTLSKIERGIPLKDDYYYDYFCAKLNLHNKLDDITIQQFTDYRDTLYLALCHLSTSQMEQLFNQLTSNFAYYQHVIYFRELHMLYHDILAYHLYDRQPENEHVRLFYEMRNLIDETNKKLLLYFLYNLSNVQRSLIDKAVIEQDCRPYHTDPLFLGIRLADISKQPPFIALAQMERLQQELYDSSTNYQKIVLYNMIAYVQLNIEDFNAAYQAMTNALKSFELTLDHPHSLLIKLHVRCAIIAFAAGKHKDVCRHFCTCLQAHSQNIHYNYLLLFHSLEQTNQLSLLHKLLHTCILSEFKNPLVHKIFYYYRLKHQQISISKSTRTELEELIIVDLVTLAHHSTLYRQILLDELIHHISISRHYKSCALFLAQLHES